VIARAGNGADGAPLPGQLGIAATGVSNVPPRTPTPPAPTSEAPLDAARRHLARGFQPVPIKPRDKKPAGGDGWQLQRYTVEQLPMVFPPNGNIGLLLGAASGGLVDVDLDCPQAIAVAPVYLPPTGMRHGRVSTSLEAHRWYRVDQPPQKLTRYKDPTDGACIVELRSGSDESGTQTMIPPSVHPETGERIAWSADGEPGRIDVEQLQGSVSGLAGAALLARHFPQKGSRHDFALALAGMLLRDPSIDEDAAFRLIELIARVGGSDNPSARAEAVRSTAAKLKAGEAVTGRPRLAEIIGDKGKKVVATAAKWLGLVEPNGASDDLSERKRVDTSRVEVSIADKDEARILRETIAAIGERWELYQRAGKLVEPMADPARELLGLGLKLAGGWRMVPVGRDRARVIAAECVHYTKLNKKGKEVDANVPSYIAGGIVSSISFPGVRVLQSVSDAPTMRPDGTLITVQGYDAATGIYLASDLAVTVPESPTLADAKLAVAVLLNVVCDFPFAKPAGRSAWLSGVVSMAVRPAFADGPAPMVLLDASSRASGKSKLADVASIIATGRSASRMAYTPDDAEMDKRITALALAGDQAVLIDNVVGELGCASLDAALTSTAYRGRILGKSEMTPHMPMHIVWWATGNGVIVGADLARRALLVRLEPQCEHPEERTGPRPGVAWKYPRLLQHVREHRAELLAAALTLVRAYVVAGKPAQKLKPMDFTEWSDLVRSAIVWSGEPDPAETVKDVQATDTKALAFRAAVAHWPVADGVPITAAELVELAEPTGSLFDEKDPVKRAKADAERAKREAWRAALVEWCPPRRGDELPTARALGFALRHMRGAIVGVHKLDVGGEHGERGVPWARMRVA